MIKIFDKKLSAATIAILMMILTLISKCLGFLREMVIASSFGTSYIVDAYVMAGSIPGLVFTGILGAVSTAFIPTYSKRCELEGKLAGDKYTSEIVTFLEVFAITASVIGIVFADELVNLLATKFNEQTASLCSYYLRIIFCYGVFTSAMGIFDSYLRYNGIFIYQNIAGYFYNISIITITLISAKTNYKYLAFGYLLGYFFQFLFSTIRVHIEGYRYKPTLSDKAAIKEIAVLAIPVFIGSYIGTINSFVDKMLASGLAEGSISGLNYGHTLSNTINGLTISAIATIMYPKITKYASNKDWKKYADICKKCIIMAIIISVPFSLGALTYSNEAVQVVFERGAFGSASTTVTSDAFFFYSISLAFAAISSMMTQMYYSLSDTKTPVICGSIGVILNIILNIILVKYMEHRGLALATSISQIINTILLVIIFRKKHEELNIIPRPKKVLIVIVSSIFSVALSVVIYKVLLPILIARTVVLGMAVIFAIIIYIVLLKLFKLPELDMVIDMLPIKYLKKFIK